MANFLKKGLYGVAAAAFASVLFGNAFLGTARGAESEAERLARMLAAFDRPNIEAGALLVSFADGTTKASAEKALKEFNLAIRKTQVCSSSVDPGGTPSAPSCSYVSDWSDSIAVAKVTVPRGSERETARLLYAHDAIVWVEPSYVATIGGDETIIDGADTGAGDVALPPGDAENSLSGDAEETERKSSSFGVEIGILAAAVVLGGVMFAVLRHGSA